MSARTLPSRILSICLFSAALQAQNVFTVGPIQAGSGERRSGFLEVPGGADGATEIPITLICGIKTGPTLALVAGTHGYEYPPIIATQRLATKIDPQKLSGRIIIVHVANMPSFLKRTIYYSPVDGLNLNRVYPGRLDGTLTRRIAYTITREVIDRSDYLVDMHCGDGNESLRSYSYWMPIDDPKVDEPSKAMAVAFGLDHIVIDRERPKDREASLYCSNTAVTRGKPAITIESGGMGVAYDEGDIGAVERGVHNILLHLKMVEGKPAMPAKIVWYDPAEVLRFPEKLAIQSGTFFPIARKTQMVEKNALLGYVTDFFGKKVYELHAPFAGEVLYILGTPPVSAGEPLAFVGAIK
ncbi:MAG TPA: M14 family metallopeptidase [Acidobacteriota bacterium]|nr:M14 family metallopeptidase [Acidobacteriota bacterium]